MGVTGSGAAGKRWQCAPIGGAPAGLWRFHCRCGRRHRGCAYAGRQAPTVWEYVVHVSHSEALWPRSFGSSQSGWRMAPNIIRVSGRLLAAFQKPLADVIWSLPETRNWGRWERRLCRMLGDPQMAAGRKPMPVPFGSEPLPEGNGGHGGRQHAVPLGRSPCVSSRVRPPWPEE